MLNRRVSVIVALVSFVALVLLVYFVTAPIGITDYQAGPGNISTTTPDAPQATLVILDETTL